MKKVVLLSMWCAIAVAMAGCTGKDSPDLIIGNWVNTEQSYEITISGQESIPAEVINMTFEADSVLIIDIQCNCIPHWSLYTLVEDGGKLLLNVESGVHSGVFVVEELTSTKMILTSAEPNIDMGFCYIMKRAEL